MTETSSPSRQEIIERVRDLAEKLGSRSVSRAEFIRETGINEHHVLKYFDSWNEFVENAGLEPYTAKRADDEELLRAMRDAFIAGGGVLTRSRFRKFARFGDDVYAKRWGGWSNVLLHFKEWVEETEPTFPHLADLPSRLRASTLRARSEAQPALPGTPRRPPATTAWKPTGRAQYGPFLNFRGLQHAPINEQGVIYLFGIVAFDLGYVVEGIGTGFPDCEAKRSVRASGDAWERVRIEFEYRSRNFLVHGHDAAECDVLVCWEHNWPDCPLEVLELRSAIESLGE
jgi:hypothetical protein